MLKRLDCKASYVEMPWKRVLHGLELGVVDIAMEAYFNEDRARYAWFSDAYNPGRSVLWIRKSGAYADTDLASWLADGHTLGVTKDYYYGAEISELLRRYAAQVSVVNDEQNYGKLVLGRIDGFLGDVLATPWGLKKEGLSDLIVPHAMAVYEAPTFFMFSKKRLSPEFVREFNRELAKFKATNEYDIIWRRYAPAG